MLDTVLCILYALFQSFKVVIAIYNSEQLLSYYNEPNIMLCIPHIFPIKVYILRQEHEILPEKTKKKCSFKYFQDNFTIKSITK